MQSPRNRPRYLPTLTQVVTEAELLSFGEVSSTPDQAPVQSSDAQAKAHEIVNLMLPKLMLQMREELQNNLEVQLHHLEAKLRSDVESMVRNAMNGCETFPES